MARELFGIEKGVQLLSENALTGVKVLFGSGAPAIEAEKGSMYLRTDVAEVYKKIDTGAEESDWELLADAGDISTLQGHIDNLVTLSGVALDEVDLGAFTNSPAIIPDDSTVKAALQALADAIEGMQSEVVYSEADAIVNTAVVLDEVLVDDVLACEWLLTLQLDADTSKRVTMKVIAQHDGTAAADAVNVDDVVYGKLKLGSAFTHVVAVALSGSTTTQKMQLKITGAASAGAISARATRIATYL
jgi:hypothetical protein